MEELAEKLAEKADPQNSICDYRHAFVDGFTAALEMQSAKVGEADIHKAIVNECESWACWKDLSEIEQDEVYEGYRKIADIAHSQESLKIAQLQQEVERKRINVDTVNIMERQYREITELQSENARLKKAILGDCEAEHLKVEKQLAASQAQVRVLVDALKRIEPEHHTTTARVLRLIAREALAEVEAK